MIKDEEETASGNPALDNAWRLLSLRLIEREDDDIEVDKYLTDNYGINFGNFFAFYEEMMDGEELTEENTISVALVMFELGALYERYVKDMKLLGG